MIARGPDRHALASGLFMPALASITVTVRVPGAAHTAAARRNRDHYLPAVIIIDAARLRVIRVIKVKLFLRQSSHRGHDVTVQP